jgi:glutathione S-transferase
MLVLHHAWASSASRRVRMFLAEKGLAYESRLVRIGAFEHHAPEYLKLNPSGVIPALVHDGRPIAESGVICEYLDEAFPDPPLRPADPYERAQMRLWVKFADDTCLPNLIVHNWSQHLQPIAQKWSDEELAQRLAKIPTRQRREFWQRIARRPFTDQEKREALDALTKALDRMAASLADRPWLTGATYSLADIAMVPFVRRIEELAPDAVTPARRPPVADWWDRIRARPAYPRARIGSYTEQAGQDDLGPA